ncbi:MAG: rod shape-determining protein RodA [Thermoleophilia bacterium]
MGLGTRIRQAVLGVDWILVAAVGLLLGFGLKVMDAATVSYGNYFTDRQMVFIAGATVLGIALAALDITRLQGFAWVILGGLLGALAVVFVLGSTVKGAHSWISLGPFNLQPSEMGKVAITVVLAALAVERMADMGTVRTSLFLTGVAAAPAAVIFLQPDLGTALVYGAILGAVLFLAGAPWTHFAAAGAALVVAVLMILVVLPQVAGVQVLHGYQRERLTAFVQNDPNSGTAGYQLDQAKTAIGSGGALGKGPSGATQTLNRFLPEFHTDFIFAVTAEMYGFVGAAGVLLLYGVILWRILRLTARAATQMEQLVAGGIGAMILFQVFVNIGMNVGIMPITGIPLPFVSYGGSHTITNIAAIGILTSIHRRRAGL